MRDSSIATRREKMIRTYICAQCMDILSISKQIENITLCLSPYKASSMAVINLPLSFSTDSSVAAQHALEPRLIPLHVIPLVCFVSHFYALKRIDDATAPTKIKHRNARFCFFFRVWGESTALKTQTLYPHFSITRITFLISFFPSLLFNMIKTNRQRHTINTKEKNIALFLFLFISGIHRIFGLNFLRNLKYYSNARNVCSRV